jgi:hypothetical protein
MVRAFYVRQIQFVQAGRLPPTLNLGPSPSLPERLFFRSIEEATGLHRATRGASKGRRWLPSVTAPIRFGRSGGWLLIDVVNVRFQTKRLGGPK